MRSCLMLPIVVLNGFVFELDSTECDDGGSLSYDWFI